MLTMMANAACILTLYNDDKGVLAIISAPEFGLASATTYEYIWCKKPEEVRTLSSSALEHSSPIPLPLPTDEHGL